MPGPRSFRWALWALGFATGVLSGLLASGRAIPLAWVAVPLGLVLIESAVIVLWPAEKDTFRKTEGT